MGFNSGFKRLNKETSQKKCTFMYIHRFGKAKLDDWPASLFTENGGWQHLGNSTPRDGFIYTLASTKYGIEIVTLRDGVLIYVQTENRKEFKDYEKKKLFSMAQQSVLGQGLRIIKASRSYSCIPHSIWLIYFSLFPTWYTVFPSTYNICYPLPSTCFRPHRPIIRRSKLYMQPMVFSPSADVFVVRPLRKNSCPLSSTCFRAHRPIIRRSKLYMQPMVLSTSVDVFVVRPLRKSFSTSYTQTYFSQIITF